MNVRVVTDLMRIQMLVVGRKLRQV